MKKTNNNSYNRIMEYLNNNIVSDKDRMFLIRYATELYKNKIENVPLEEKSKVLNELKIALRHLENCENNSVKFARIKNLLLLCSEILNENESDIMISKLSYCLDKLYLELDLPLRESSLSFNLNNLKRKSR